MYFLKLLKRSIDDLLRFYKSVSRSVLEYRLAVRHSHLTRIQADKLEASKTCSYGALNDCLLSVSYLCVVHISFCCYFVYFWIPFECVYTCIFLPFPICVILYHLNVKLTCQSRNHLPTKTNWFCSLVVSQLLFVKLLCIIVHACITV